MPTASSGRGRVAARALGVCVCVVAGSVATRDLVTAMALEREAARPVDEHADRISDLLALAAWRSGADIRHALDAAQDVARLPVQIPGLPKAATRDDGPGARERDFIDAALVSEMERCSRLQWALSARNELVAERDVLLAAHRARIEGLARRYPAIRRGIAAWAPIFQASVDRLRRTLSDLVITTTTSRGAMTYGSSQQSGTDRWSRELASIAASLRDAQSVGSPYEAMIHAENAVSQLDSVEAEVASIPSAPPTAAPRVPTIPPLPRFPR